VGRVVRLLCLANDLTYRNLVPDELAKGFGFFQSKPATARPPVRISSVAMTWPSGSKRGGPTLMWR
jgi:fumarylacetoacetate (FAA) hydrolase